MFPLRDSTPARRFPVVTVVLIVLNVAAYVWEELSTEDAVLALTFVPVRVNLALAGEGDLLADLGPLFTSMFLHAGLLHLAGNLWFLRIFGDNVEDRLGHLGYLGAYVAAGLAAGLGEALLSPHSDVPVLGASGAVAGVLGAYLWFFPRARILTLVPIVVIVRIVEIPAVAFLGIWFLFQFASAALGAGGVAWWAHIVGFLAGLLFALAASGVGARSRRRAPSDRARR